MKTGNVKQVANFEKLVSMATALGAGYNPAKGSNKLPALNALLTQANQSLQIIKSAETKYLNATNARVASFGGIDKLTTRMVNAIASSDATEQMVDDAMKIKHRMERGKSAKSSSENKSIADNSGATTAIEDPPIAKSRSGGDFDNKAALFAKLLDLIASELTYKPNEVDLQVATLTALGAMLRDRNLAVANATAALQVARINRSTFLYRDGIHKVAKSVKCYVKSAFGAKSEQYASIGGLRFLKK